MSWKSTDSRRKYARRTQDWPKRLWIGPLIGWPGPRIGWPIFSTLMGSWWNRTSQRYRKIHYLWRWLVLFHQQPINVEKMGQLIQGPIQRYLSVLRYFLWMISEVTYVGLVHYGFVILCRNYYHLILEHVWYTYGARINKWYDYHMCQLSTTYTSYE